ncbi:S8 family serine peptidase [Aedoeadaptatus pacaensis]|uniref:S8 family serine peptidase n=1 Tax=Aedoeadaptatus pacaensis TaxID=1776390 RepID=UPI00083876FF|nr:S8 family serine peptidase [Peptoniphilus pacaensis]
MSIQGVRIRRFVIPVVLSFLMLFTAMISPSFAAAPNGAAKAASFGDKDPSETITLLVALKERKREKRTGIPSVDAEDLNTEANIRAQVAYSRAARETFYKSLKAAGIKYHVVETYDVAYTGVALEVKRKDIPAIEKMNDVESVEISQQFKAPKRPMMPRSAYRPMDTSSNGMVEADKAHSGEYNGKGSLIAVIDSGIDPYHESMKLSDTNSGRIKNQQDIQQRIKDLDIARGDYFTAKIPFGYNYANKSTSIKEHDPMSHGMHVSGIVAGNGGKIRGVAPEAQIAFMRVFGGGMFGNGTTAEIYTKAIDDAIKLGVDSMNISIGSPAGTEDWVFPNTVRALENAKKAGILVAVAAGNNGFFGNNTGTDLKPKADNPDIGMLADPAVSPNSLAVASIQNLQVAKKGMQIRGEDKVVSFQPTTVGKVADKWVGIKDCGWGRKEDFKEQGDAETYALIERGEPTSDSDNPISFTDKIQNAEQRGYGGVIIYDNEDNAPLIQMEAPGTKIPAAFIKRKDGLYLKDRLDAKVRFNDEFVWGANEHGGEPSEFSSWGMTPQGNLKPDIAAPGGGILSSLNDNQYGVMDGTSMAAPHVAGGIALVKQRVERDFANYQGSEKYNLIKKLLMSTAEPYKYEDSGAYASPRQQGSGLMKVDRALKAKAYIEGNGGLTSINLGKSLTGDTVKVPFKIVNLSNETKTYKVYGVLNTDKVENGKMVLKPKFISRSEEQIVKVAAGTTKEVELTMPITGKDDFHESMKNGFFLEGFVFAKENGGIDLSAPYVGFYGSFDQLDIAEKPLYDLVAEGKRSFYYNMGGKDDYYGTNIGGEINKNLIVLGAQANSTKEHPVFDKSKIAFSPNGDGRADKAIFMATFLRNFAGLEMKIIDSHGKQVYYSNNPEDRGVKNFFIHPLQAQTFANNMMTTKPHWQWDGKGLDGKPVADGHYTMTVKTWAAGKKMGADSQTMTFPLTMDRVHPRVTKAYFDNKKETYTIEAIEETGSGLLSVVLKQGEKISQPKIQGDKYIFDIKGLALDQVDVEVSDQARNLLTYPLSTGTRTGKERSVRVNALAGSDPVAKEAFDWTVQSPGGNLEDPNNLSVGKHVLVIEVKDPNYKLIGEKTIPFEITESDLVKEVPVRFETLETNDVFLSVENTYGANASLVIQNKDIKGQEFVPTVVNDTQQRIKLPQGNYTIGVRGLENGYYALVEGGEDFTVQGRKDVYKTVKIEKKENKEITIKIKRKGYTGRFQLKLTGKDLEKTVQKVDIEPNQDEKTVRLDFIPSDVKLNFMEDGYYGLSNRSKSWDAQSGAKTMELTLVRLNEKPDDFVDFSRLRDLVDKVRKLDLKKDYEYDRTAWDYIKVYLPMAEQMLAKEDAKQEEVDQVYNNLMEGYGNLRKKGESIYKEEALKAAIKRVESLKGEEYTEATFRIVESAVKEGQELLKKPDEAKTQADIDRVKDQIEEAIDGLVRRDGKQLVNKKDLQAALDAYKAKNYDEDNYTPESYDRLYQAVQRAEELLGRKFPSQEDIDEAVLNLQNALRSLQSVTGEKERTEEREALLTDIQHAKTLKESDWTPETWHRFKEDLKAAENIYKQENSSLERLKYARNLLQVAERALEKRSDVDLAETETYELPYEALKATEDAPSMAGTVFKSPAKVIKETAADGKVNYKVVLEFQPLSIGDITGYMRDVICASEDQQGSGSMPITDKVLEDGYLKSVTLHMGNTLRPIHFIQIKYFSGVENIDWIRLKYSLDQLSKLEKNPKKPEEDQNKKLSDARNALTKAIDAAEAVLNNGKHYTKESALALETALEKAKITVRGEDISSMEAVRRDINLAISQLLEESPTPEPKPTPKPEPSPVPKPDPWPRQEPRHESPTPSYRPSHQGSAPEAKQPEVKKEEPKLTEQKRNSFTVKAPEKAYVKGFPDGSFKPNKKVTRGEVAQILNQFIQNSDAYRLPTDVDTGAWYGNSIARLYGLSILNGFGDGSVRPQGAMTRAEVATIMSRILNLKVENARFNDVTSGAWYNGYVGAVQAAGIISGYPDGTFGGERTVTRAELVVIVNRAFKVVGRPGTMQFKDVPANHWAYKEIQKAAN